MTISPAIFPAVTVTVVRDRKIRTAPRTNQIAGFVTVPSWKKIKILNRFLEFPSVKFLKIWQRSYSLLAFLAFNLLEKFVRQGFRLAKKTQKC